MESRESISLGHFSVAGNYFQLVENILTEMIKSGNPHEMWAKPDENIQEKYLAYTKWSDFRIIIPTLFNLFHGLELLIKAGNYKVELPQKIDHDLSELLKIFKKIIPRILG